MLKLYAPSDALKDYIEHYVVVYSLQSIHTLHFLPNAKNFVVFNRGAIGYSQSFTGEKQLLLPQGNSVSAKFNQVKKCCIDFEASKEVTLPIIMVELKPQGYYQLFNQDAYELNEHYSVIPEAINTNYFSKLYTHGSVEKEIQYLNKSFTQMHQSHGDNRICLKNIVHKIVKEDHFESSVKKLLDQHQLSRSTLERHFKKVIGVTPKHFMLSTKFCRTLTDFIEKGYRFQDLPYNYSDQSHMNNVFKKFLGSTPKKVLNDVANQKIKIYQLGQLNESQ